MACAIVPIGTGAIGPPRLPQSAGPIRIEPSVTIVGDLWSEGSVQVDGQICGNVNCAQLIVGRNAAITGTIIAKEAVVLGRITGTIRATRVLLQSTAPVESVNLLSAAIDR